MSWGAFSLRSRLIADAALPVTDAHDCVVGWVNWENVASRM
jgi:hypothetical protein